MSANRRAEELVAEGLADFERGDYSAATAAFDAVLELDRDFARAWCARGMVWHRQGEPEQALAHYRRALELDPNYARAHFNCGMLKMDSGDPELALKYFDIALGIGEEGRFYFQKGLALDALNRRQEAIVNLTEARRVSTTDQERATVHVNRGICYFHDGDFKSALSDLESSIRLAPERLYTLEWKAHVLHAAKQYEQAAECLSQVIERGGTTANVHYCRALTYHHAKKYEHAI